MAACSGVAGRRPCATQVVGDVIVLAGSSSRRRASVPWSGLARELERTPKIAGHEVEVLVAMAGNEAAHLVLADHVTGGAAADGQRRTGRTRARSGTWGEGERPRQTARVSSPASGSSSSAIVAASTCWRRVPGLA